MTRWQRTTNFFFFLFFFLYSFYSVFFILFYFSFSFFSLKFFLDLSLILFFIPLFTFFSFNYYLTFPSFFPYSFHSLFFLLSLLPLFLKNAISSFPVFSKTALDLKRTLRSDWSGCLNSFLYDIDNTVQMLQWRLIDGCYGNDPYFKSKVKSKFLFIRHESVRFSLILFTL